MNQIGDIKLAMDQNPMLEENLKHNILELVEIFQKHFPNVTLNQLGMNLKTLQVERYSSLMTREPLDYNPYSNTLIINPKALEQAADSKNLFMNIVIRLIASKNGMVGFDSNGKFLALNLGYIASMANMLVGNESEHDRYADEIIATNLFGKIVGDDLLEQAFFTNNPSLIIDKIAEGEEQ